jgi:hypothetical protein
VPRAVIVSARYLDRLFGKLPSLAHQIPHPIGENITLRAQGFCGERQRHKPGAKSAASRLRLDVFAGAVSCKVEEGSGTSYRGVPQLGGTTARQVDEAGHAVSGKSPEDYTGSSISFFIRSDFCPIELVRIEWLLICVVEMVDQVIWRRRWWNVWLGRRPLSFEPGLPLLFLFTVFADVSSVTFAAELLVRTLAATHMTVMTRQSFLACH